VLLELGVDVLRPDPAQPRRTFIKEEIDRLAASIGQRGVLQPLRVRPGEEGFWWIVLGESRWRAARQAGLKTVPCLRMLGDPREVDYLADQVIENVVRASLRPLELARALAKLKALKGCNSRVLAEELGLSGSAITRAEALLTLPPDVQEMVDDGRLAESAAYEISRLPGGEQAQRELALAAEGGKLNRERVVEAVRGAVPKRNVMPRASRVTTKVGGLSITVSGAGPLTWQTLLDGLDALRKQARKLSEGGKEINELARLRAS
jgi:ParB family transcriptional regulator, chromosome partitioning protein